MVIDTKALIEWKPSMSVGLELLDADHRQLINMINDLEQAGEHRAYWPQTVAEILAALGEYAKYHFEREERVMAACGFAEIAPHHARHDEFVAWLDRIADRFRHSPEQDVFTEMVDFLRHWWVHHILIQDMAYRPLVEGNAEAEKAAKAIRPLYGAAH